MPDRAFLPGVGFPVIEEQAIVEMKYRRELPAVLKHAVETFKLSRWRSPSTASASTRWVTGSQSPLSTNPRSNHLRQGYGGPPKAGDRGLHRWVIARS